MPHLPSGRALDLDFEASPRPSLLRCFSASLCLSQVLVLGNAHPRRSPFSPHTPQDFEDLTEEHAVSLVAFFVDSPRWRSVEGVLNGVSRSLEQDSSILVGKVDQIAEKRLSASYADSQSMVIKFFFQGFPSYSIQYVGAGDAPSILDFVRKVASDSQGTLSPAFDDLARRATVLIFHGAAAGGDAEAALGGVRGEMQALEGALVDENDKVRARYYLHILEKTAEDSGFLATTYNEHHSLLRRGEVGGDIFVSMLAEYRVLSVFTSPLFSKKKKKEMAAKKQRKRAGKKKRISQGSEEAKKKKYESTKKKPLM